MPRTLGLNNNLRETKYLNFAPRLGATYALGEKTVIRTGVGLYYMEDIGNAEYFDMARITAARVDTQASTTNLLTWANAAPGGGTAAVPPTLTWAAAYDHATPRTWQYLVNVERQLAANWSVELGYLGSQSRHLYGFQTLNQAAPGPLNSINSRVPYPTFGVISYVSDSLEGHYNAFSIKATRRYGGGLGLNTSYTLAKSIDNSSGTRTQGYDTLFPQDSRCLECETGPSSFDVRHRWVMGAVYDLPFGKGKPVNIDNAVLDGIFGGWQLSTNTTIQSGVPQTLSAGKVQSGTNALVNDRPSSSGVGDGYAADPSATRWYDPASFVLAPEGQFGTVARNSITTPHLQQIDAVAGEEFPAAEWPPHSGQGRSLQRVQHSGVGRTQRKHPGGRGIPGRARERGASGLRRHHHDGAPDAPDSARAEVFVLSEDVRASPARAGSAARRACFTNTVPAHGIVVLMLRTQ